MSEYLKKLPGIDDTNRETLKSYIRKQELRQLQPSSIQDKTWRVYYLLKFLNWKDAREISKEDLEDYIIERRKTVSPRTLQGDMIELRIFFRFLDPAKEKEFFPADERMQKPKIEYPDALSREEIQRLVEACRTVRDRALVKFFWDTGCRLDEALSLNIGKVTFDQYGGEARIKGKTGERINWLVDSVPELQAWLATHPMKGDPEAPLFITYSRYGFGGRRLNERTVQNLCKVLQKNAGISKEVHPHAFRHARATDRAREGFTEMELRIMFGWSKSSNMPAVYIHLSGADVKKKVLQKAGLQEVEDTPGDRPLDPVKCPRCGLLNERGFWTCARCNTPLSPDAMRYLQVGREIMEDPDLMMEYARKKKQELAVK